MCGIISYIGTYEPDIQNCLKALEYRGYDSVGQAYLHNGEICISKAVNLNELKPCPDKLPYSCYIGHTRWATHGEPGVKNAHPHVSNDNSIAVVHNGIIENYQELKTFLAKEKFIFFSETDSEIIPNLISFYHTKENKSFFDSTLSALSLIEGDYAIVAISSEGDMIAARRGSPLVLGVRGDRKGFFVASDIPAFYSWTDSVVFLKENDVVTLNTDGYCVFNFKEGFVERKPRHIHLDQSELLYKGSFEHYMLKEISEQTTTVQCPHLIVPDIPPNVPINFLGCGSSYYAGLAGSYIFDDRKTRTFIASEFSNFKIDPEEIVIAISQSGETADVIDAVRGIENKIYSIVNVEGSTLTQISEKSVLLRAGTEKGVLSTKTYTAQLAALYRMRFKNMESYSRLKKLANDMFYLLADSTKEKVTEIAQFLLGKSIVLCIGRGVLYPTALEAALKIKEVSYIHAEGFAGGELKHGPLALVEQGTPCVVFVSPETEKQIVSNAIEIKSRGGVIIGISHKKNEIFDYWIRVADEGQYLNPVVQIIPIQILAYQLAVLKGLNPDKPRNLAKAVTVK